MGFERELVEEISRGPKEYSAAVALTRDAAIFLKTGVSTVSWALKSY
jgi:hypothetical protein